MLNKDGGNKMTVCIAAIYNGNSILGISDRMITAGDVQFEPPSPKIVDVTNSIVVMTAGDANIQTQLLNTISPIIINKVNAEPQKWISVSEVADLYRNTYIKIRSDLAEKAILSPYGLDYDSFISRQKSMSDEFVNDLSYKLRQFSIEAAHTIVAGLDESGPHIFVVRNDNVSCDDRVGFAAVGIGSNHAISHFMLSGYTRSSPEPKALLTIHQAKKKSEASPGVGQDTDMFVLGPNLGTFNMLVPVPDTSLDVIKDMDGFYKKYKAKIARLDKETEIKIKDYLARLTEKTSPTQQAEPIALTEKAVEKTVKKPRKVKTPVSSTQ